MPKRTLFTNITPLPPQVTREVAVAMLHNHDEMIELNPLVVEHHPIETPRNAPTDEFLDCVWQELTDKIHYLPGGLVKGKVSYKACFHDTPLGLQTHIYAPMGLDIREKWSIGGSLPGELPEPRELGLDTPRQGLYIREDGDMRCNIMLTGFVRKNLDNAHKVLVERILKKAVLIEAHRETVSFRSSDRTSPQPPTTFQSGSHMARSRIMQSPVLQGSHPLSPQMMSPQQDGLPPGGIVGTQDSAYHPMMQHPAFRSYDEKHRRVSSLTLPPYQAQNQSTNYNGADDLMMGHPSQQKQHYPPPPTQQQHSQPTRIFMAELPGSTYHTSHLSPYPPQSSQSSTPNADRRMSYATEVSGSEVGRPTDASSQPQSQNHSDRGSVYSNVSTQSRPSPAGMYKYNPQDFTSDRYSVVSDMSNIAREFDSRRISDMPAPMNSWQHVRR